MRVGDVVLTQDSNQARGNWKLGKVFKVYPGDDAKVKESGRGIQEPQTR